MSVDSTYARTLRGIVVNAKKDEHHERGRDDDGQEQLRLLLAILERVLHVAQRRHGEEQTAQTAVLSERASVREKNNKIRSPSEWSAKMHSKEREREAVLVRTKLTGATATFASSAS